MQIWTTLIFTYLIQIEAHNNELNNAIYDRRTAYHFNITHTVGREWMQIKYVYTKLTFKTNKYINQFLQIQCIDLHYVNFQCKLQVLVSEKEAEGFQVANK